MTANPANSAPGSGRSQREIRSGAGSATTCANREHESHGGNGETVKRAAISSKAPRRRELVSLREFARRKGWRSHTYVLRLVRRGVITLARGGRVDPVRAEAQLAAIGHGERLPEVTRTREREREEAARRESGAPQASRSAPGRPAARSPAQRADDDALEHLIDMCKAQCLAAIDELARRIRAGTTRGVPR